jgi:hypothetical protein
MSSKAGMGWPVLWVAVSLVQPETDVDPPFAAVIAV